MKALTITQPWASLVALGHKTIETRAWRTDYVGPLAIHAAKGWTAADREFAAELAGLLVAFPLPDHLPRGMVVATARLAEVLPTNDLTVLHILLAPGGRDHELLYGDFAPDRWAWLLERVHPLAAPVPARGALGLWEWAA